MSSVSVFPDCCSFEGAINAVPGQNQYDIPSGSKRFIFSQILDASMGISSIFLASKTFHFSHRFVISSVRISFENCVPVSAITSSFHSRKVRNC